MINLQELKNRKPITVKEWTIQENMSKGLKVILTDVNVLSSVVLYNLLFRLEGMHFGNGKNPEVNLIDDGNKVEDTDIILGNFMERDKGRKMVDVLVERYQGVFTTPLYKITEKGYFYETLKEEKENMVVLGTGKNGDNSNTLFKELSKDRIKKGKFGGVLHLHGLSEKDDVKVYTNVLTKLNDVMGKQKVEKLNPDKKRAEQIIMENQVIANTMIMLFNTMVTDDDEIKGNPYSVWTQNMVTGDNKSEYHKEGTTLLHKRGLMGEMILKDVDEEKIEELDENFKSIIESITKTKGTEDEYNDILNTWGRLIIKRLKKLERKKMMVYEKQERDELLIIKSFLRMNRKKVEDYALVTFLENKFSMLDLLD